MGEGKGGDGREGRGRDRGGVQVMDLRSSKLYLKNPADGGSLSAHQNPFPQWMAKKLHQTPYPRIG